MKVIQEEFKTLESVEVPVPADEPVLIIRASDPAAQFAMRAYVTASNDMSSQPRENLIALNEHADKMREYAREHPELLNG